MKFLHIMKRTSLIIFVTVLLIFNTVLNSFVSCCETKEELFLNNDDQACCVCCSDTVNKTSLINHSSGKTQTTIDDCNSCACISYINTSDKYFVFATTTNHVFSPTLVKQKTDCLSTVVLLI
jgi:hypothetical protein